MSTVLFYILSSIIVAMVLLGIYLMSKVKMSAIGNKISAFAMLGGVIVTLVYNDILSVWFLYVAIAIGLILGLYLGKKIKMIQMPQMVALLNGLGGGASALVGVFSLLSKNTNTFSLLTASLAVTIGMITLLGSLVAAGKLQRILPQKPIVIKGHQAHTMILLLLSLAIIILSACKFIPTNLIWLMLIANIVVSSGFGIIFSIRVGGADMPITISLLNSLSGVAGAIAGLAINNIILVAVGGIVGASGLLLTQIMCKAINRSLFDILLGKSKKINAKPTEKVPEEKEEIEVPLNEKVESVQEVDEKVDVIEMLNNAKKVIIVPGYGMAIAQAQHLVKQLADKLVNKGAIVKYAIHPVAGRMPGHMNVLLCEANVDYEDLYEMDDINSEFAQADATIVIGANDVLNPAAREAVGTPIYGMPVLNVDQCENIFIFNFDKKPGYAGVDNPLYSKNKGVHLYLGDAAKTLLDFITLLDKQ